ncbi:hypothetical protein ES703_30837 [subsurface metagenome]|nr:hypothetical protein [bacterium]
MSKKGKRDREGCCRFHSILIASMVLVLLVPSIYPAQETTQETTISMNMLLPPHSPAFTVLGIEPESVERPGNPTDFAISVLQAIDSLTTLPRDYAAEFTPYWWNKQEPVNTNEFVFGKDPWQNFLQTATISLAFSTRPYPTGDTSDIFMGVGLRCSILRGEINPDYREKLKDALNDFNDFYAEKTKELMDQDTIRTRLKADLEKVETEEEEDSIITLISEREDTLKHQFLKELLTNPNYAAFFEKFDRNVENAAERIRYHRIGPVLDLAGAGIVDFPQAVFKDAQFSRWGAWITGGYGWQKFSTLGVLRHLGNLTEPERSRLGLGIRGIWDATDKLSLSGEGLIYKYWDPDDPEWHSRGRIIIDFALWKNNIVSLSVALEEGKLAPSVSFKQGIGSQRPFSTQ